MDLNELIKTLEDIKRTITNGDYPTVLIDIDYGKKNNRVTYISHETRYGQDEIKAEYVIIHN